MKNLYLFLAIFFTLQTTQSQNVNITDVHFKNVLLNYTPAIDTNGDNEIQITEAEAVKNLEIDNLNIQSLEGINAFVNLETLGVNNTQITTLDISKLSALIYISIDNSLLITSENINFFDINTNEITGISFSNNQFLTHINTSGLPTSLGYLNCTNNQLTSLEIDFNNIPYLAELFITNNPIDALTFVGGEVNYLYYLICKNTNLVDIELNGLPNLSDFSCNYNPYLKSVTTGGQKGWLNFGVTDNPMLETISFKDGVSNSSAGQDYGGYYSICNNSSLKLVCADESEIENLEFPNDWWPSEGLTYVGIKELVANCGYTDVAVSSYCDFEPGGSFKTVKGANLLDVDADGCNSEDTSIANLKYAISNSYGAIGSFTSNDTGDYLFYVTGNGTHIITPVLENSAYYTVSPESFSVDLSKEESLFTQDFCITPNGDHTDVKMILLPLEAARPGFDATYKITYKNIGSTTVSGSVALAFQEDVLDFVSSNPNADVESAGNLSYNYSNLLPLESREIIFSLNLNTPTETPALSGDEVLNFTATITPLADEENIEDNTFVLNQTVVNSFDPNDKTCLEGTTLLPDMIGKYVHYMIRFENTGTANATNIVVKDIIDTTKFNVNTLLVTDTSHITVTRVTGNKVEFISENINLPFDDANNDGYVVFKIKTLDTLVVGDTFTNDAEIYFDYNYPIDTNIAETLIKSTLSTSNYKALNSLKVYLNTENSTLVVNEADKLKSVTIYNISGSIVQKVSYTGTHNNAIVSTEKLTQGIYFVKVNTSIGEVTKKVLKN
ncbi:DUF7619 domain-containing protein [Polaribacter butkevichii]|uniref:Uncharacterized protein n=1 Tax=Polaribacter butkevichii TaxID=218490 RepID=A0A2P6CFB8_9FLAO|nr:T9SS type A sorting domain-containing protein [Polaribacter butkevichii]PQJ73556.1 hypothetical protein BTO14_09885 [Polaribacter butkevichii]